MTKADLVAPRVSHLQFFGVEEQLRAERNNTPNYRLANATRRYLAGVVETASSRHGLVGEHQLTDLNVAQLKQVAISQLGVLAVRSASAAITLLISGYEVEASVHVRRLIECNLRGQAILHDSSGQHAHEWLQGRARPSAERLAQRYGNSEDLTLLSISAHADARGLALLHAPDLATDGIATVPLTPYRSATFIRALLYGVAYETGMLSAGLAEAFGFVIEIPPWISQELIAARDSLDTSKPTNEDNKQSSAA